MASIQANSQKYIYQIEHWLGLNESPDGDTGLAAGEAAAMRNFRITREGHLQIRPGYGAVCELVPAAEAGASEEAVPPVQGLWNGFVAGRPVLLAACGGRLWQLTRNPDEEAQGAETFLQKSLGEIDEGKVFFFGFSKKVYLLTGSGYYVWDGTGQVEAVEGYVPLTMTAAPPEGGGTLLEQVNKLTGKRRNRFSPDGTATVFQLSESEVDEVCAVEGTPEGVTWSLNRETGKVTFSQAPAKGVNSVTITYRKGSGDRPKVEKMRYAETFGVDDARVFLYGDGSNEALYSGLDEYGNASAAYFPDLNVAAVGTGNTPLTGLVRHYDRLICFKPDGAWALEGTTVTLADGSTAAAFTVKSINREVGNEAPGQVRLVDNNPRTLSARAVYTWPMADYAVRDERNAQRISDRVHNTLGGIPLEEAMTFDDGENQEYYLAWNGMALVHNYAVNAWYYYTNLPATCFVKVDGGLYFGTADGRLMEFSRKYRNDAGGAIDAWWESGSMDFQKEWMRKYSSLVWVSLKPEVNASLFMTVQTDRKSDYPKKPIGTGLASFLHVSFAHWSFRTNRKPKMVRAKLKVKKAAFYKLVFFSRSHSATATVLSVDIQVRYTGNVK